MATPEPSESNQKTSAETGSENAGNETSNEDNKQALPEKDRNSATSPSSKSVTFKGFNVNFGAPVPAYNNGSSKAYLTHKDGSTDKQYVTLICDPSVIPRISEADRYYQFVTARILPLQAEGPIILPKENKCLYGFVYEYVAEHKLVEDEQKPALGWRIEETITSFIRPIMDALEELGSRDFVHGSIRLDNIFCEETPAQGAGHKTIKTLHLGDCLSVPCFSSQSVLYEPVNRAMAAPLARGLGDIKDDIYAFGVCVALLVRTRDPLKGMSDEEIMKQKIANSTYTSLTSGDRFTGKMLEFLRGTLHDDPDERWGFHDIQTWLDGKFFSPKQITRAVKASRPLSLGEEKYYSSPVMALDVYKKKQHIIKALQTQQLQQWVKRSLENEKAAAQLEDTLSYVATENLENQNENKILALTSIALAPDAPIRYGQVSVVPDGIGIAMANTYIKGGAIKPYIDVIKLGLVTQWLTLQNNNTYDVFRLSEVFDKFRKYIDQTRIGYGIERCLYFICPDLYCLSDKVKNKYAETPEQVLQALESFYEKPRNDSLYFFDRHITAFISLKEQRLIDNFLYDLNSTKPHIRLMAELKALARMQRTFEVEALPNIGQALAERFDPVFARIHNTKTREKTAKSVIRYAQKGNLIKALNALDNQDMINKDYRGFRIALHEYARIEEERSELEQALKQTDNFDPVNTKKIAAAVSTVIAVIIILFITTMTSISAPDF